MSEEFSCPFCRQWQERMIAAEERAVTAELQIVQLLALLSALGWNENWTWGDEKLAKIANKDDTSECPTATLFQC